MSTTESIRTSRGEAIVDAAALLFSTQGYADTGIDEIGSAVGVTGPAVYRHFASKEDLLVAVLQRAVDHAAEIAPRARAEATSPEDQLARLIEYSVSACIGDRVLTALYWQHAPHLPGGPRQTIEVAQRRMIDEFAEVLRAVRPDLNPSEARMAIYGVSSLMRSVAQRETTLDEARVHRLLASMANAALLGADPTSD